MRLAGYPRVSSEGQVDAFGKPIQIDGMTRWATLNGHEIVEWFHEDAVSGTIDGGERPQMAEIVRRADEFDGVIAFNVERFGRRLIVQETLFALLWNAGLRVFTSTAGEICEDEEDPTRILVRQILGVIAEFDHRTTVRKLQAGRKARIDSGGYGGGGTRYGIKVEGVGKSAKLVGCDVELAVISEIQDLYAQGLSLRAIASQLNSKNIPTKTGKRWAPTQVQRIIMRHASDETKERRVGCLATSQG